MRGKNSPKTPDEYLASVPEPARSVLEKLRMTIRAAVPPEATEAISYGMPAFRYKGALIGFAAFSKHCSLFPMGSSAIEQFRDELKGFQTSKGTIQFTVEKPLPTALVRKIVKARVAENDRKKSA